MISLIRANTDLFFKVVTTFLYYYTIKNVNLFQLKTFGSAATLNCNEIGSTSNLNLC